jgi:hypothetical protein
MTSLSNSWQFWTLLSAAFAALTAISSSSPDLPPALPGSATSVP